MPQPPDPARASDAPGDFSRFLPRGSLGLKLLLVCALALAMAIPIGMVWALGGTRSYDAGLAAAEVAQSSGGQQTLLGPALVVPFEREVRTTATPATGAAPTTTVETVRSRVVVYPETGSIGARLVTELRRRGLHDVPVYTVDAGVAARFDLADAAAAIPADARLVWAEAKIYLSLTDPRGARSARLSLDGRPLELAPAEDAAGVAPLSYQRLVAAPAPWLADRAGTGLIDVSGDIRLTGAERLAFAAFARDTTVRLAGDWGAPSFDGQVLPDERTVEAEAFTASWSVPYLARGAAGAGENLSFDTLVNTAFGVTLLDESNPYRSVERALKYAPMFIGLVFLTYFLFEATGGGRAHPAQYLLVGLAQVVFYLLLLSIAEHLGFTLAFLIAATATVLTLALYAGSVFRSARAGATAFGVFAALYGLIWVLLQMETYALLVGSVASFLAIAGTMWMTRNLDWYGARLRGGAAG